MTHVEGRKHPTQLSPTEPLIIGIVEQRIDVVPVDEFTLQTRQKSHQREHRDGGRQKPVKRKHALRQRIHGRRLRSRPMARRCGIMLCFSHDKICSIGRKTLPVPSMLGRAQGEGAGRAERHQRSFIIIRWVAFHDENGSGCAAPIDLPLSHAPVSRNVCSQLRAVRRFFLT